MRKIIEIIKGAITPKINKKKKKLVVYSVLIGAKEGLNDPLQLIGQNASSDIEIDYYCFADKKELTSPTWKFKELNVPLIPVEKASRLPKAKPHEFFPDYEFSLYIDNTVVFKRLPCLNDLKEKVFAGFKHPWRNNPSDEAFIIVKSGLDEFEVVAKQLDFYEQNGTSLAEINQLTTGTVILRKHMNEEVMKFGELWWQQILLFSKRDQISFDLCLRLSNCKIEYFEGDKTQNDLFLWPVVSSERRVLGSFDSDKYKWLNRTDSSAISNPKKHFLEQKEITEKYERKQPLFEYSCRISQSSLSNTVAPRRGLSLIIESILQSNPAPEMNILIAGVSHLGNYAASPEELFKAQEAIKQYYKFTQIHNIVIAMTDPKDIEEPAPFLASGGLSSFDLIFVIGMPCSLYRNVFPKFISLLNDDGKMLIEFNQSISTQKILEMHAPIGYKGKLDIFHGQHILSNNIIPNSVFVLTNS